MLAVLEARRTNLWRCTYILTPTLCHICNNGTRSINARPIQATQQYTSRKQLSLFIETLAADLQRKSSKFSGSNLRAMWLFSCLAANHLNRDVLIDMQGPWASGLPKATRLLNAGSRLLTSEATRSAGGRRGCPRRVLVVAYSSLCDQRDVCPPSFTRKEGRRTIPTQLEERKKQLTACKLGPGGI